MTAGEEAPVEDGPGPLRKWAALFAPIGAIVLWTVPLGLTPQQQWLAGIFVAVVVLWLTEIAPIAITALLIGPAMVLTGVCDADVAFAPYADELLFLFIGGFMIARAMTRHGLDRRIALTLVSLPILRGMPSRIRGAFIVATALISFWISNTATAAIIVPIFLGLIPADADRSGKKSAMGSLLAIAYAASIGGLGTPVGSPPNLIAMRFLRDAGHPLTFFDWVLVGAPVALVLSLATYFLFERRTPAVALRAPDDAAEAIQKPWTRGEKVTAISFGLAVTGWVVPGILQAAEVPGHETVVDALPGGAVAVFAASILFFIPDGKGKERVLPWSDGVRIDWGLVLLFGGGISLGRQLDQTGLAQEMSRAFVAASGVNDVWTLTFILTAFTVLLSEACSNTATASMLAPLAIGIADQLGVSPIPPVLAVGIGASCAFMLPIGTGPNAIVFGTGRVTQEDMIRAGFWIDIIGIVLIFAILRVLCPLYGWV